MLIVKKVANGFKCSYENLNAELLNHVLPPFGMEVVYSEQEIKKNFDKNFDKIQRLVKDRQDGLNYQLTDGIFSNLLK